MEIAGDGHLVTVFVIQALAHSAEQSVGQLLHAPQDVRVAWSASRSFVHFLAPLECELFDPHPKALDFCAE